jgi:N-acetylmuramoyl-L-alanine amidase
MTLLIMLKKIFLFITLTGALSTFTSFESDTKKQQQTPVLKTIIIDAGHGLPDPGAKGKYSTESELTLAMALKVGEKLKALLPECNIVYTRTNEHLPEGLDDKNAANRLRAKRANENHGDLFIAIHVNSMKDHYKKTVIGHKKQTYYSYTGKGKSRKKIKKTRTVPVYKYTKLPCSIAGTETYIWAVAKNDQKKQFVSDNQDFGGEETDSSYQYFDSPEAKIMASVRTQKYFDRSLLLATFVEDEFKKEGRTSFGVKQRNYEGIWVLQATAMPSILVETGFICNPDEEDYLNSEKGQNEVSYAVTRAVLRYKQYLETGIAGEADTVAVNQ